jgi:hypothetical protein
MMKSGKTLPIMTCGGVIMWQGLLPPSNKSCPRKPATVFGKGKASCALNFSSGLSKGPDAKDAILPVVNRDVDFQLAFSG